MIGHRGWRCAAELAVIAALAFAAAAVVWLAWTSRADPHGPYRGPLSTPTPTAAAPR